MLVNSLVGDNHRFFYLSRNNSYEFTYIRDSMLIYVTRIYYFLINEVLNKGVVLYAITSENEINMNYFKLHSCSYKPSEEDIKNNQNNIEFIKYRDVYYNEFYTITYKYIFAAEINNESYVWLKCDGAFDFNIITSFYKDKKSICINEIINKLNFGQEVSSISDIEKEEDKNTSMEYLTDIVEKTDDGTQCTVDLINKATQIISNETTDEIKQEKICLNLCLILIISTNLGLGFLLLIIICLYIKHKKKKKFGLQVDRNEIIVIKRRDDDVCLSTNEKKKH